jgi:hypothetical protein
MHVAIKNTRMRFIAFGPVKGVFIGEYLASLLRDFGDNVKPNERTTFNGAAMIGQR